MSASQASFSGRSASFGVAELKSTRWNRTSGRPRQPGAPLGAPHLGALWGDCSSLEARGRRSARRARGEVDAPVPTDVDRRAVNFSGRPRARRPAADWSFCRPPGPVRAVRHIVSPTLAISPVRNAFDGNTIGPAEIGGKRVDPLIGWCMTYPINFTGHPAISVPAGLTSEGLPVGLQIIGRRHADEAVLALASRFERAQPWFPKLSGPHRGLTGRMPPRTLRGPGERVRNAGQTKSTIAAGPKARAPPPPIRPPCRPPRPLKVRCSNQAGQAPDVERGSRSPRSSDRRQAPRRRAGCNDLCQRSAARWRCLRRCCGRSGPPPPRQSGLPAATSRISAPEFISLGLGNPAASAWRRSQLNVAIVSQQPLRPHRQSSPPTWTKVCPNSPPAPATPR